MGEAVQWRYEIIRARVVASDWQRWLTDYGNAGWELVHAEPIYDEAFGGYVPQAGHLWIFKRPVVSVALETPEGSSTAPSEVTEVPRVAQSAGERAAAEAPGHVFLPPAKPLEKAGKA
jgi:hypothetical protein